MDVFCATFFQRYSIAYLVIVALAEGDQYGRDDGELERIRILLSCLLPL